MDLSLALLSFVETLVFIVLNCSHVIHSVTEKPIKISFWVSWLLFRYHNWCWPRMVESYVFFIATAQWKWMYLLQFVANSFYTDVLQIEEKNLWRCLLRILSSFLSALMWELFNFLFIPTWFMSLLTIIIIITLLYSWKWYPLTMLRGCCLEMHIIHQQWEVSHNDSLTIKSVLKLFTYTPIWLSFQQKLDAFTILQMC